MSYLMSEIMCTEDHVCRDYKMIQCVCAFKSHEEYIILIENRNIFKASDDTDIC